jgi:hypothetical protein
MAPWIRVVAYMLAIAILVRGGYAFSHVAKMRRRLTIEEKAARSERLQRDLMRYRAGLHVPRIPANQQRQNGRASHLDGGWRG